MKAIAIQAFGGPEGLAVVDLPAPAPAAGQVVIATEAVGVGGVDTVIRSGALAAYGFKDEQVKPFGFNPAPFIANKASVQQGYVTSEPLTIEKAAGFRPNVFLLADYGFSTYSTTVETRREVVEKNPDLVQRFMNALAKSQEFIRNNPDEAGAIFAEGAGVDEKTGVDVMTRLAADDKYFTQALTVAGLTNTVEGMQALGAYNGDPIAWDQIIDQEFLPKDSRIDLSQLPGYEG